jgi:TRAP-type uncharacterized transport system substrate-binding protein
VTRSRRYVPEIFNLLGISADIRFGAFEQMASQMTGGKLDGVAIAAGFPIPALAELDGKRKSISSSLRPSKAR